MHWMYTFIAFQLSYEFIPKYPWSQALAAELKKFRDADDLTKVTLQGSILSVICSLL